MFSLLIRLGLALLVVHLLTPCAAFRNNKGHGKDYEAQSKTVGGTSSGIPSQNSNRKGLGISAWGIVVLIVALILAGMGLYYFSICYPILCKKEGSYNMIGLTNV